MGINANLIVVFVKVQSFQLQKFEFPVLGGSVGTKKQRNAAAVAKTIKGEVTSILLFMVEKARVTCFFFKSMCLIKRREKGHN